MAGNKQSQVTTLDDDAPAAPAPVAERVDAGVNVVGLSGQRKTVTIHTTPEDGGSDPVFVGVNGHGYQIPRGKPCDIPVEVLEILNTAHQTLYAAQPGGGVSSRTVQRFPFTVHG